MERGLRTVTFQVITEVSAILSGLSHAVHSGREGLMVIGVYGFILGGLPHGL